MYRLRIRSGCRSAAVLAIIAVGLAGTVTASWAAAGPKSTQATGSPSVRVVGKNTAASPLVHTGRPLSPAVVRGTIHLGGSEARITVDGGFASADGVLDTRYLSNAMYTFGIFQYGTASSRVASVQNNLSPFEKTRDMVLAPLHGDARAMNVAVGVFLMGFLVLMGGGTWYIEVREPIGSFVRSL